MKNWITLVEEAQKRSLPDLINTTRDRYNAQGVTTYDIGNGYCEDFASDVLDQWIGEDWRRQDGVGFELVETDSFYRYNNQSRLIGWDWTLLNSIGISIPSDHKKRYDALACMEPNHVWIMTGGKHYDAESPYGEASFFDLKFFQRHLSEGKTR